MTTKMTVLTAALVVATMHAGGCRLRPRVAVIEPEYKQAETDYVADKRVSVGVGFRRVFNIQYLNRGLTDSGAETVQAKVMNKSKSKQILMYRFQWVDKNGMALDGPTSQWTMKHLDPGEIVFISGVATSDKAADFLLSMKQHVATRR